jgi:hypothetical protein
MRTLKSIAGFLLGCSFVSAQNSPGIHARGAASDYAASQQTKTAIYAASLVPVDQVKHLFATDISKSYIVFEVACYPSHSGSANLDPDDFLVKAGTNAEFVHPAEAAIVASVIQEKNTPRPAGRGTDVYTTAGIGYESGTDPYTGRRVHGTYTQAGVGVANGPDSNPPYPAPPGSTPQDRALLEQQLAAKALPSGNFTGPVAGFLYFPAKALKKAREKYELEYLSDSSGRVKLSLATKPNHDR